MTAIVLGRVGADLYPLESETPLERVERFQRFVGGFAGNVATGLARLGVRTAIVSAVGDDGHGRFVRAFLAAEGVDVRWLTTHPVLRTALAFCELWPPDRFPITFYRTPTCPDWELRASDLPLDAIRAVPLLFVTGTGLAREPSRSATLAALDARAARGADESPAGRRATIFDLDWRPQLWENPADYPPHARRAAESATIVLGGEGELAAARLTAHELLATGVELVVTKRGGRGVVVSDARGEHEVRGIAVEVVNGLGAGDAFAATFAAALLDGRATIDAAERGNAAGAIVTSRLACSAAMPRASEIDQLLGVSLRGGMGSSAARLVP